MGDCGFSLFGCSNEVASAQQAQQKAVQSFADSPEAKNYVCFETKGLPWAEPYDINKDGKFGIDDMKARRYQREDSPIDSSKEVLDVSCALVKIDFLEQEAKWKLQELIAWQPVFPSGVSILGNIETIQSELLAKLRALSNDVDSVSDRHNARLDKWSQEHKIAVQDINAERLKDLNSESTKILNVAKELKKVVPQLEHARSMVTELALRSRAIAKDPSTTDELFGVGFGLMANQDSGSWWPLQVGEVLPFGAAAAAGILVGDRLMAVDGKNVAELSTDGSVKGLLDPDTHLMHGFAKPRDASTKLTIKRGDRVFDTVVANNVWSGRYSGAAHTWSSDWDGKVSYLPKSK